MHGEPSKARPSLYVLLSSKNRVSRSFRARWYFQHLLNIVEPRRDDVSEDLTVVSQTKGNSLSTSSDIFFIHQQHSLVMVVDFTSSMMQVSNQTFSVKLDEAVSALITCLQQLVQPLTPPDTSETLYPQPLVTVLAYTGFLRQGRKPVEVLMQGVQLHRDNMEEVVAMLRNKIQRLESDQQTGLTPYGNNSGEGEGDASGGHAPREADSSLEGMIKAGVLGVQLLPRNTLKGLVLLTDGVAGFSSPQSQYSSINQLRTTNISCWVVLCGGGTSPSHAPGMIPDTETLGFMTHACNGCLIDPEKLKASPTQSPPCINSVQQALLLWTFQQSAWQRKVEPVISEEYGGEEDPFVPQLFYSFNKAVISAPFLSVIGCRIREGFFISQVMVEESQVEVMLVYPWQPDITVQYTIRTAFPISQSSCPLQVEVSFEAPYSFVHYFQYESDPHMLPGLRPAAFKRFRQVLKGLIHAGGLLAYLLSFSSSPAYYTLPQSACDGTPLFTIPPNQSKPVPSSNVTPRDEKSMAFLAKFWKPLCTIDINTWPNWFHTDKLILILNQDTVLPPHIIQPSPSGRYSTLHCRVAASKLFTYLRQWSSFVLLDNHSYIKLLPEQSSPQYFCHARVAQVPPCLVLHLGYIEGTPQSLHRETLEGLSSAIRGLTMSLPGLARQVPTRRKVSLPRRPCANFVNKLLQRALINRGLYVEERPIQKEYLSRHQWKWEVPHLCHALLTALLHCRLQEGFLLASAHSGHITLIAELSFKQPSSSASYPALIQYVLLPLEQSGSLCTELWVEPQYHQVDTTPTGLTYLLEATAEEIPYRIQLVDQDVLTMVNSFLVLSKHSHPPPPQLAFPLPSPLEPEPVSFSVANHWGKSSMMELPVSLPSLFGKCHVTAFIFTAFMDSFSDSETASIGECSLLNRRLHSQWIDRLQQLAPSNTTVSPDDSKRLVDRMLSSKELQAFSQLCKLDQLSSHLLWRCFTLGSEEDLFLFFIPCFLRPLGQDSAISYCLPFILMYCNLPVLLGNEPVVDNPVTLPADVYFDCQFASSSSTFPTLTMAMGATDELSQLRSKLKAIHTSAYVFAMRSALGNNQAPSLINLQQGLKVCHSSSLSVSLTALVSVLCQHCLVRSNGGMVPLSTKSVASLLENQRDAQTCRIKIANFCEDTQNCQQQGKQVEQLMDNFLTELGFREVIGCHGYYWHSGKMEKVVIPAPSVDEENEEGLSDSSADEGHSSDEELVLSPLLSPTHTMDKSLKASDSLLPPLFLSLQYCLEHMTITSTEEVQERVKDETESLPGDTQKIGPGKPPLCTRKLIGPPLADDSDWEWTLTLHLQFFSLFDNGRPDSMGQDPLRFIPRCHHATANGLRQKLEWLVYDELLSRARELAESGQPVSPSLLQSVAAHVQGSKTPNCLTQQVTLKFIPALHGASNIIQFHQQLQAIKVPGCHIHCTSNDYLYITPMDTPPNSHRKKSSNLTLRHSTGGSYTPPIPPVQSRLFSRGHRRSSSWSIISSQCSSVHTLSGRNSIINLLNTQEGVEEEDDDVYAASSSTHSSVGHTPPLATLLWDSKFFFWLVLRVLPQNLEIYLQFRGSVSNLDEHREKAKRLCEQVAMEIEVACHRTNQRYLLKEMLDTHVCSPLLLPESKSDAWVSRTLPGEMRVGTETFQPNQFECEKLWSCHIIPHWRLKHMNNPQAPLLITRTALEAFAVSNRDDVYVLQDVRDDGEEAVFYLKIYESLCLQDAVGYGGDDYSTINYERCDTRATVEDTLSNYSYQRSIPDITEASFLAPLITPTRQLTESTMSLPNEGNAQESIVLELYGIMEPSESLKSRLQRRIQLKLDDVVLEMMCSNYQRNQRLYLSPADVQFLQPSPSLPSEILSLLVPSWVLNPHALFFYMLQQLNQAFIKPQYTSSMKGERKWQSIVAPPELAEVLKGALLPDRVQDDHLFLYIRPLTKGRGMAVVCASLLSPEGVIIPPQPGILPPSSIPIALPINPETIAIETVDEFPHKGSQFVFAFHIWQRGNVGMEDLMEQLSAVMSHALCDMLLELHALQLPIAVLLDEEMEQHLSPALLHASSSHLPHSPLLHSVSTTDTDLESTHSKQEMTKELEDAMRTDNKELDREHAADKQDWQLLEKQRRLQASKKALQHRAFLGQIGTLEDSILTTLPSILSLAQSHASPSVQCGQWSLPSSCTTDTFFNHSYLVLTSLLPDLSMSIFTRTRNEENFVYISPDNLVLSSTTEQQLIGPQYVMVGRNLVQWEESLDPGNPTRHITQAGRDLQLHLPLDSWKNLEGMGVPLVDVAKKHSTFVPRQVLLLFTVMRRKVDLWLYNMVDRQVKAIQLQLSNLLDWQKKRTGFLQTILTQKMGLFHHTNASDIAPYTKAAAPHCTTLPAIMALVKNTTPVSDSKSGPPGHAHLSASPRIPAVPVNLHCFYQDHTPSLLPSDPFPDVVGRHGQQLHQMLLQQRMVVKWTDLLGKVFASWHNRNADSSLPVSSGTISSLKRTSRLLHYCSSPLLFLPDPPCSSDNLLASKDIDNIRELFLTRYIEYLKTLQFHPINERPGDPHATRYHSRHHQPHPPSPTHSPDPSLKLYRCLQRSWSGGIILIELSFKDHLFHVKLFSLECSRLSNTISSELKLLFSLDCGRMKDLIHVHSFSYDFHLHTLLDIIRGRLQIHLPLNLRSTLNQFCEKYKHPPSFIRNRLATGRVTLSISVDPEVLYKHVITHGGEFNVQTLELERNSTESSESLSGSSALTKVSLFMDLSPATVGLTTTPELSRILHDTCEDYDIIILVLLDDSIFLTSSLSLRLFLLLVNKTEQFPRLTINSSAVSHLKGSSISSVMSYEVQDGGQESVLHHDVRNSRRKLGYGSLNSPSSVSQVVINPSVIAEQMAGLQNHFKNLMYQVQGHVRRDDLWKRLLYGKKVNMEVFAYQELSELLQLVTMVPFDSIDQQLLHLQCQTKRWYRHFSQSLEQRFQGNVHVFTSDGGDEQQAVIINPDWQDMLVVVISNSRQTGFFAVYRKPQEGGVPQEERRLSANIEADHTHLSNIVNYACSFMWSSIIYATPTLGGNNI